MTHCKFELDHADPPHDLPLCAEESGYIAYFEIMALVAKGAKVGPAI
jgi:hypothetical protein